MNKGTSPRSSDASGEAAALIETLQKAQHRLEVLTDGEVDTVADRDGRTFLLARAQERMRDTEAARQAAVLNALPANIALLDAAGIIVSVNDAWRKFAATNVLQGPGYGIGFNYLQICDDARGDGAAEARQAANGIRSVLDGTKAGFSLEYPCHSPTEARWFLMTASPLAAGNPNGAVVMHLDITERKLVEDRLRESEARFRSLTGMSSDFYWESDADHRLVTRDSANRKPSMVAAFRRGTQIGERRWEIPHLSPDEAGWRAHRAVLDAHVPFRDFELSRLGVDGAERFISISGDPEFDASGAFKGYRGIGTDITDRKLAEDVIKRERQFTDSALDSLPGLYYLIDEHHRFLRWNKNFETVSGYTADELSRLAPTDLFAGSEKEMVAERMKEAFLAGESEFEAELISKNHTRTPYLFTGKRIQIGDKLCLTCMGRDLIRRRLVDANILRLNRVLSVLSAINGAIVRNQNRDALFAEVCRIAVAEGQFTLARVVELDSDGKARIAATTETDSRLFQQIVDEYNADPEHCLHILALGLRAGQPMVSNDVANDPRMPNRAALTKDGSYALAILPFAVEKRMAGAIVLRSREAGMFDDAELRLLLEVVANLSFALEHIGKEAKVLKLTRVYRVLSGINSLIVRARNRDEMFREACRIAVEHGAFAMAWIGVVDRAEMKVEPIASAGVEAGFLEIIKDRFPLAEDSPSGDTMSARAVRDRKAVIANDIRQGPGFFFVKERLERGILSIAVLPLMVADEAVGVLALYSSEVNFFDADEMRLLTELAGDIAFAIDHIGKRDRLEYLAFYDELTGLANRSLLLERVAQYMHGATGSGKKLALFFLDLERFRNINDSLGRPAGDAILRQVSDYLSQAVGNPNLLARLGADQFAIVVPEISTEDNVVRQLESRIRQFVEHTFIVNGTGMRIAARAGAALFPNDGTDAATLLRNAEAALKKAKSRGEPYLFYKSKMNQEVAGKLSLENQLREALDKEQFVLHYQPKLRLDDGALTGAEVLIRWNDPRTGLVPPDRFIPVLEETGLIQDVGRWALRKAVEDYLRWRIAGLPALRIAVNVSPMQLRSRDFVDQIRRNVGVDAHAAAGLELEITESLIMEDVGHSIASLRQIREMGVTIAIDDFGTGFSSLSYLAKLPVDTLKIDRSFVSAMALDAEGLSLVSTIISLAHSLRLKVVAEGVETEEQSRLLRLLRCDEMQGFLFSKPVPVDVFEAKFLVPGTPAAVA